jgi:ribonuclease BN (tRNA processing enzyme)
MHIKVLGTRGEIEPSLPYHSRHSGVLVDGVLLLDLGEREFLDYRPQWVFITHLHPDHAFFINQPLTIGTTLYAPEPAHKPEVTKITTPVKAGRYLVTPVPTHHSKKVASNAYIVDDGRHKLLYTGDVIWIDKEYHRLFDNLSLVITDGSYIRQGGLIRNDKETGRLYGHAGIPNLIHLFHSFTRHILFIHFGSWFFRGVKGARAKLNELGKANGITIHVGYDGMEMDLNELE